jgi:hypothetical protein
VLAALVDLVATMLLEVLTPYLIARLHSAAAMETLQAVLVAVVLLHLVRLVKQLLKQALVVAQDLETRAAMVKQQVI